MVYKEDFVAVIKNKGKILRENNGIIKLPFGSEYEVLMKNKNSVRALVNVEVDGKDALDGNALIVDANEEFSLKGFMKGTHVKNRFRFIKKTKQVSNHRGDRLDDGIVRVEFQFEKHKAQPIMPSWDYDKLTDDSTASPNSFVGDNTTSRLCYFSDTNVDLASYGDSGFSSFTYTNSFMSNVVDNTIIGCSAPLADEGITVKGSEVNQDFVIGYIGELETRSHVINIKLQGYKQSGKVVQLPITTKTRLVCPTCGKKSKSSAKFCSRCSTFLD